MVWVKDGAGMTTKRDDKRGSRWETHTYDDRADEGGFPGAFGYRTPTAHSQEVQTGRRWEIERSSFVL
ncbi:unnamed protein product [Linum trigynum]|uniref:Uncharacterized protein n=1 Tax=Linum trigynum TaxID=586398 RepID=A0AAV2DWZ2_9ROSI